MIRVNIVTGSKVANFLQQLNKEKYPSEKYYIKENSDEDIVWDLVVVYENINNKKIVKYKSGCLIFISGEPPMSRVYPRGFLNQFDYLLTSHKKIKHPRNILSQQALNWHYARSFKKGTYKYDYSYLKNMPIPQKTHNISVISSSKAMMPGHNRRLKLLDFLRSEYGDKINFYGKGFLPVEYKYEALDKYRFHICIENSSVPHYWTEKMADPLLAYTIPIYIGCPNIDDYFHGKGYIPVDINDFSGIKKVIDYILLNPEEVYDTYLRGLKESRNLLLDKYNLFEVIFDLYNQIIHNSKKEKIQIVEKLIRTCKDFKSHIFLMYKLRLYRLLYKYIFKLRLLWK